MRMATKTRGNGIAGANKFTNNFTAMLRGFVIVFTMQSMPQTTQTASGEADRRTPATP